jgi:hypothetical protein
MRKNTLTAVIIWRDRRSGAVDQVTLHVDQDAAEYYLAHAQSMSERTAEILAGVWVRRAPDLRPYGRGKAGSKMVKNTDGQ